MLADMPARSAAHAISFQGQWDWSKVLEFCHRVARATTASAEDAQDAAQEAAVRAWRHRRACRQPDPRPWLAAIVRREVVRVATSRHPDVPLTLAPQPTHEHPDVLSAPVRLDVRRALASLSEDDRELVVLRYAKDLKQKDIAAQLDIPEGTVKVRLHRARAKLRPQLTDCDLDR
jgi:RNA polymerase sigma-70 factor, ECF subfamily